MNGTGRICRRCLLRELDSQAFASVYQYIESLPPEEKAPPAEYARRLALCRQCPRLQNGMCALCGCFVEVRAAKGRLGCPQGLWQAWETPANNHKEV